MKVDVKLPPDGPAALARRYLARSSKITVGTGATAEINADGLRVPLTIVPKPAGAGTAALLSLAEEARRPGHAVAIVAAQLGEQTRDTLEDADFGWIDGRGGIHIQAPGLLVHIEPPSTRKKGTAPAGLGVVAVRAVQAVAADTEAVWTVSGLASTASASIGQAHRVLTRLEEEGLIRVIGSGPSARRLVLDRGALLDWVATIPAATRVRNRLPCHLYVPSRTPLTERFAHEAQKAGLQYAITGATAAQLRGAQLMTSTTAAVVRVATDLTLELVAKDLGARPVDRGSNLILWEDHGELGVSNLSEVAGLALASDVRIWLDLLADRRRGEDAAALFREQVLD